MAVNASFTARTTDGTSTAVEVGADGFALVEVQNDSVMDGARIIVDACSVNTAGKYSQLEGSDFSNPGVKVLKLTPGYFVRLRLVGSTGLTSVNATITT